MSPFESYLTMRGIKTLAAAHGTAMRQRLQSRLLALRRIRASTGSTLPAIRRIPTPRPFARLFPANLYGAMVSFELKGAGREEVFPVHGRLEDDRPRDFAGRRPHGCAYPAMSSHRELSPKHRQRLGIRDNLIRLSIGIEAAEDIIADLEQAFAI